MPGEDGKLQGYFDLLGIPYSNCGVLASALTFNKYFCNIAVEKCGVPISPSLHFYRDDFDEFWDAHCRDVACNVSTEICDNIIAYCGFPCFVKPCNSGSSVGVSKAHNREELVAAIALAFQTDTQIMIERFVRGREMTCGVTTWKGKVMALAVTEIKSKKEYYDFEAKYTPGFLEMITPAEIDSVVEEKIKRYSETIYKKLGCNGVVRMDFIINPENEPVFLEINTIPGQTAMSIIPKQLEYNNISLREFYGDMILSCRKNILSRPKKN
jgi:D-alanine-D-alanine ligase